MLVVISYDVSDDKRRYRIAKLLESFGSRVLESVFECDLTGPQFTQLERRFRKLLEPKVDRARVYFLCSGCAIQTRIYGPGKIETSQSFYIA
jgi:CRISPR-associated protein Cas2